MQSPSRRTFLAFGTLSTVGLLAACSGSGGSAPGHGGSRKPDPDLPLRTRAVAATDALLGQYDAALAGAGDARLKPLRAELAEQRAALAAGLPAASPAASPSAPATAPTVAALATAERTTAQARLVDLGAASPELARLLASVSAAGARHAVLLGDPTPLTGPAPAPAASDPAGQASGSPAASPAASAASPGASGSPSGAAAPLPAAALTALQAALAAEHAAVYGYGVIGARIPAGPKREDARAVYAVHQARRDAWQRILSTGGATPTAAAPGYQLPFAVPDAVAAGRLAAYLETRLTAVYADLVAGSTATLRDTAAVALRESVLQGEHWGAPGSALPGLPTAADGSSASPGSSSPAAPSS